jgi:ATP-dependent helicase HrpA
LVEEYRVSLFAQELGTAEAVSPQRLEREFAPQPGMTATMTSATQSPAAAPKSAPTPISVVALPAHKGAPMKSLGALGDLFRK